MRKCGNSEIRGISSAGMIFLPSWGSAFPEELKCVNAEVAGLPLRPRRHLLFV